MSTLRSVYGMVCYESSNVDMGRLIMINGETTDKSEDMEKIIVDGEHRLSY